MSQFSYCGLLLPELPVTDGYQILTEKTAGEYWLYVFTEPVYYGKFSSASPDQYGYGVRYEVALEGKCYEYVGNGWRLKSVTVQGSGTYSTLKSGSVIWANHDILNVETNDARSEIVSYGEPVLNRSLPVLVPTIIGSGDLRQMSGNGLLFIGWLTGRLLSDQRENRQNAQPVAYRYNGLRLSGLPEEAVAGYRYFAINLRGTVDNPWRCILYASSTPFTFRDGAALREYYADDDGECQKYMYIFQADNPDDVMGSWMPKEKITYIASSEKSATYSTWPLVWANYDLRNQADGSVYLAASEPVPVYD